MGLTTVQCYCAACDIPSFIDIRSRVLDFGATGSQNLSSPVDFTNALHNSLQVVQAVMYAKSHSAW